MAKFTGSNYMKNKTPAPVGNGFGAGSITFGNVPGGVQDPNKVAYTAFGNNYNYGGDVLSKVNNNATGNYNYGSAMDAANQNYQNEMLRLQRMQLELARPGTALKYDINSAMNTARAQAGSQLNPYYQDQLNLFLKAEALKRGQEQTMNQMNMRNIEDTLGQTLESNATSRTRTAEDTGIARQATNTQEDQMQTDTGTAFDDARIEQARQLFVQGMTTSGAGARQMGKTQADRNLAEQRASEQFDLTRAAQDLFQNRTFEDLAKGDQYAQLTATKGREKATGDLASFRAKQDVYKETTTKAMEMERQRAVDQAAGNIYTTNLQNWISGIGDTKTRQATREAYM